MKKCFLVFILVLFSVSVQAHQYIKGKIISMEVSYMPASIIIVMDTGNTACPAGTPLKWQNQSWDNNKIIQSNALAAMLAGKKISFVINDNDTNCIGQYFYIHNE